MVRSLSQTRMQHRVVEGRELEERRSGFLQSRGPSTVCGGVNTFWVSSQEDLPVTLPTVRRTDLAKKAEFHPPFPKPSVAEIRNAELSARPGVLGNRPNRRLKLAASKTDDLENSRLLINFQQELTLANNKLSETERKVSEFERRYGDALSRVEELSKRNQSLEQELHRLGLLNKETELKTFDELQATRDDTLLLKSQNQRLLEELREFRLRCQSQHVSELQGLQDQLLIQLQSQERQFSLMKADSDRVLQVSLQENSSLKQAFSQTQQELMEMRRKLEEEIISGKRYAVQEEDIKQELRMFRDRAEAAERRTVEHESEKSDLRRRLEEELVASRRISSQLEDQMATSKRLGSHEEELLVQLRQYREKADRFEHAAIQLERELSVTSQDKEESLLRLTRELEKSSVSFDSVSRALESQQIEAERNFSLLKAKHQDEIDSLQRRFQELQPEAERNIALLKSKYQDELDSVQQRIRELEALVIDLKSRLNDKDEEIRNLQALLNEAQRKISYSEEQLESRTRDLDISNQALNDQIEVLRQNLSKKDAEMAAKDVGISKMKSYVDVTEQRMQSMLAEIGRFESIRRKMHNAIQQLKGNIRVFCRVRPPMQKHLLAAELDREVFHIAPGMTGDGQQVLELVVHPDMGGRKERHSLVPGQDRLRYYKFTFDRVFQGSDQESIFDEIAEFVQSVLDGYRVCIFAYGQTGSGKTYTMEGDPANPGIIPRSIEQIFSCTESLRTKFGWSFTMYSSFIEIYNEELRDLLNPNPSPKGDDRLHINHINGQTAVAGATIVEVARPEQVFTLLQRAGNARAVAETKMNDRSSRSHSVFKLEIMGECAKTGERINGILNLIDLAGSERLSVSGSVGTRMREAQNINKSLCALADVISSLANKEQHVPYRNSKLTYLLQESLGGDCKMLMFANLGSEPHFVGESLCTLRFADKVNSTHIGTATKSAKVNLSKVLEDRDFDE